MEASGGALAGPLDPGGGPLGEASWLDPWILASPLDSGWTPGFCPGSWISSDFVRFLRFRQILEFLADFGTGGQILVLEVILITSCAYRIILGIIYPLEMLFRLFWCCYGSHQYSNLKPSAAFPIVRTFGWFTYIHHSLTSESVLTRTSDLVL